jgi:hypothetical protein
MTKQTDEKMTEAQRPGLTDELGRGRYLGVMYLARRPCGKVSATCWDDVGHEKETAKSVAGYIKRGDIVERVERYEHDPMPEWICKPGCEDCKRSSARA